MKKGLCFIVGICLLMMISACQTDEKTITMMVPYGSTQLSQLYLEEDEVYDVDIISGPQLLISAFSAQTHDVIIAPMTLGAKLYLDQPNYRCLAVIVWGNLYIVSDTETFDSFEDLDQKTITLFGQNQTADILIAYLMDAYQIDINILYVDALITAQAMLLSGQADIILTAEPSLSLLSDEIHLTSILDIQQAYQALTGSRSYPQAGIFIHKDMTDDQINKVQADMMHSIETVNTTPLDAAILAQDLGIEIKSDVLIEAIHRSNLSYMNAFLAKNQIEDYFDIMMAFNPNLMGDIKPDSSFYYTV